MSKSPAAIVDLFRTPGRFMRSVQLDRDFVDPIALDNYVVTPQVRDALARIIEGLQPTSGRRAWRVTGDYGIGKSSFALALAHHLEGTVAIPGLTKRSSKIPDFWPILLTGSRKSLLPAIAQGIAQSLRQRFSADRRRRSLAALADEAEAAHASGKSEDVMRVLENVRELADADGAGVLLIIDELGKLLEFAAQHPDSEDVFVLQRLAEMAARSAARPFLVLGLLHQGFQAYAERLPSLAKHEWEKVAGRFEEIVFNQPLSHVAALISGSLNVDTKSIGEPIRQAARSVSNAATATGWLSDAESYAINAAKIYPLHPTVIPALVRFFARFGQNERSLFGFLLSSEPFGLQAFALKPPSSKTWYDLSDFYDYVRTSFGHCLAGASYRNQWLRILATIDAAAELDELELRILKAIALLNLLDADDLLPTEKTIPAAFSPIDTGEILKALSHLKKSGLLFRRGPAFRLWPNGSVGLDNAVENAARTMGPVETVAMGLDQYLDRDPILARRHYLKSGTLRYFELRYANATSLSTALQKPTDADGIVIIALADTNQERDRALIEVAKSPFSERTDIVVGIVQPLLGLAPELHDVRCWQWVADHTPELSDDPYAAAEVGRQLASARSSLAARLASYVGLRNGTATGVAWFCSGKPVSPPARGGLSALLSTICDEMFDQSPLIANELLNRNILSSPAAAARMRLIEGIFSANDKAFVGIDPVKSPPERSMYLSVLQKGAIHLPQDDQFILVEPKENDPLRLQPAMARIIDLIESARGNRVSVTTIFDELRQAPYGVRAGVLPLLLAIILCTRSHELAVYDQGTFLHRFGPADFLRLTKAPDAFEIQHCRVAGVRLAVFNGLAAAFARDAKSRRVDLLDVVKPLCQFAAQLPDYTRRTSLLSQEAIAVRDGLLSAREPATMLFRDLPLACGVAAFSLDEPADDARAKEFVTRLHSVIGELRAAYPALLNTIISRVTEALGEDRKNFDRAKLASRAARVSLAAREPRLRTFALRLRDPGLSDEAWAEALASFIIAKPPARWLAADEARFTDNVSMLAELFHKVEATAFHDKAVQPAVEAMRLNLTRGDGVDLVRVIDGDPESDELSKEVEALRGRLPQSKSLRLQMLAKLLWNELHTPNEVEIADAVLADITKFGGDSDQR
jgi:hypothetical protein